MDNFDYQAYLKNNPLLKEDERTDAEQEGYKDGFNDAKDDVKDTLSKMKVSEFKEKIRTEILSTLSEESQYEASLYSEAEIDEEVERFLKEADEEVDVEVDGDNIDIEDKGVDATIEVGLSPEEKVVQDSLQAAMEAANSLGNQKLADQIGNTITFFTREYVVGRNSD
jgi:glutathionylspermidine synthase